MAYAVRDAQARPGHVSRVGRTSMASLCRLLVPMCTWQPASSLLCFARFSGALGMTASPVVAGQHNKAEDEQRLLTCRLALSLTPPSPSP
jgi:hypothetical protein